MTPKDDNHIPAAPSQEEDYSLEEILAEYGGSLEHHLLREAEPPSQKEAAPETAPKAPSDAAPPPPQKPLPKRLWSPLRKARRIFRRYRTPCERPRRRRRPTWPG